MDKFEKKYNLKENEKTKQMHKTRRMFCIIGDKLFIAELNASYSHAVWFEKEEWIKKDAELMEKITRGMVDPKGNIYFYVGYDFRITKKAEKEIMKHLPELVEKLNVSSEAKIYGGFTIKKAGEQWPPKKCYGTVGSFIHRKMVP
ncbi:MAG: hypothetical protein DRN66_04040 [Candidatus Nanohalarchaeota archaeon]|nr:MAG: hypothetical protein DRN66_04040 [Candidatus Nanohaloarchaeota archaeon]